ncbi:MAG: hypothetical protein NVS9B15_04860 [Acidobacteriaceae bacterium]
MSAVIAWLCWTGVAQDTAGKKADCTSEAIRTTPTRPTVSFPADTTQCGVIESEYGFTGIWNGGTYANTLAGALRYGLTPHIELRWDSTQLATLSAAGTTRYGIGDNLLLAKYKANQQTKWLPAFAVSYQIKVPTASPSKGLGSGFVDHMLTALFSKDIGKYHFDQNTSLMYSGSRNGFHHNNLFTLAGSRNLTQKFQVTAEGYGVTSVPMAAGYASFLVGASYATSNKTVFDMALDNGLTSGAPEHRIIAGVTHAFGRVHRAK